MKVKVEILFEVNGEFDIVKRALEYNFHDTLKHYSYTYEMSVTKIDCESRVKKPEQIDEQDYRY